MAGNVGAVKTATDLQLVDPAVGVGAGSGQGFAVTEHNENAATTSDEVIPFNSGSGMQNVFVINWGDDLTLLRRGNGIPLAGHDDTDGCAIAETEAVDTRQFPTGCGSHNLGHGRFHHTQ